MWPQVTEAQQAEIAELAQAVLDVCDQYPDSTIAQMEEPGS
ncbi:MAG: type IIL restriction-modification enzyme MmeI [Brooklawnia sp.]